MVIQDKNGEVRELIVEGCVRRGLEGVHLVRAAEGEAGLEGLEGEQVELVVDWERRVDHVSQQRLFSKNKNGIDFPPNQMSCHTSQHLLSAILDVHAEGLPTLSWSMSAYPSLEPPYIELPRALTWAEVEQVEKRCNEVIEVGKNIWVDVDMQGEGFVKTTAAGVRENRGIPTDYKDVSSGFPVISTPTPCGGTTNTETYTGRHSTYKHRWDRQKRMLRYTTTQYNLLSNPPHHPSINTINHNHHYHQNTHQVILHRRTKSL
jgi:Ser-tRNA(Ala) deacylase AlaX